MAYGPQQESMQIQEIEGKQCPWVYMRTVYKNQGSMSEGQAISQPVKNDNIPWSQRQRCEILNRFLIILYISPSYLM